MKTFCQIEDEALDALTTSIKIDTLNSDTARLKGEAKVLRDLLALALDVLHTIAPESAPADAIRNSRMGGPVAVATGRCLWCDDLVPDEARWCGTACRDQWCKERGVK